MKFALRLTHDAHLEEAIAFNYYEDHRDGLGDEFLAAILTIYRKIEENPFLYSFVGTSTLLRDVKVPRFPYLVVFFIDGTSVVVVSVRCTYRIPFQ